MLHRYSLVSALAKQTYHHFDSIHIITGRRNARKRKRQRRNVLKKNELQSELTHVDMMLHKFCLVKKNVSLLTQDNIIMLIDCQLNRAAEKERRDKDAKIAAAAAAATTTVAVAAAVG